MTSKLVIVMAGGGAAGKSTTSKAFAYGTPVEYKDKRDIINAKGGVVVDWVHWTVYDNCALTGNHHSGTDSNGGPSVVDEAFRECMNVVDVVIIDGYTSSPLWIDTVNDWCIDYPDYHVEVLCVHFKLSDEELLRRLANRRKVDADSIRAKYLPTRRGVGRRGDNLTKYFQERCVCDVHVIAVADNDTTAQIVQRIDDFVLEYFQQDDMLIMEVMI